MSPQSVSSQPAESGWSNQPHRSMGALPWGSVLAAVGAVSLLELSAAATMAGQSVVCSPSAVSYGSPAGEKPVPSLCQASTTALRTVVAASEAETATPISRPLSTSPVSSNRAPSPWWLIVMPAIPILGGVLIYIKRRWLSTHDVIVRGEAIPTQLPENTTPTPLQPEASARSPWHRADADSRSMGRTDTDQDCRDRDR